MQSELKLIRANKTKTLFQSVSGTIYSIHDLLVEIELNDTKVTVTTPIGKETDEEVKYDWKTRTITFPEFTKKYGEL